MVTAAQDDRRPRLAYVVSRFPLLSETFILRELEELRARGWDITLIPLLHEQTAVRHQEAEHWERTAWFTPLLSGGILLANARALVLHPRTYLGLWRDVLLGMLGCSNYFYGAMGVFPKSVYLAERARRAGIQHVHAHYMSHPAVAALIIARLAGVGFSVTAHAHDLYVYQDMLPAKVRAARFVATISEYNRRFIARCAGTWALEKTHLVRAGVDLGRFTPTPLPADEPFRILSVASLQPYKGLTYLVSACALLKRGGLDFDCRVIGDGELRDELEIQARALGVDDRLHFLGPKPQHVVAQEMARAHVVALPSIVDDDGKMEGVPVVLMEALASGRPVVATRLSGIPELVRHGQTGLLVKPGDAHGLASALQSLAVDRGLAERLAQHGRLLVEEEFSLAANVSKLEEHFRAVAAGAPAVAPEPFEREGDAMTMDTPATNAAPAQSGLELRDYLVLVLRGWWMVALAVVVAAGLAGYASRERPPVYSAAATFIVAPGDAVIRSSNEAVINSINTLDRATMTNTFARIASSQSTAVRAGEAIGYPADQLSQLATRATVLPDTFVIQVSVEGGDATRAAAMANTILLVTGDFGSQAYPAYQIRTLDRAFPPSAPSQPQPVRDAALGGIAGLGVGVIGALVTQLLWASARRAAPSASPAARAKALTAEPR